MANRQRVEASIKRHVDYVDRLTDALRAELSTIAHSAQATVSDELRRKLAIDVSGRIERTPGNMRILRGLDRMAEDAFGNAGSGRVIEEFVDSFGGQMIQFRDVLESLSESTGTPLKVNFRTRDIASFQAQQVNSVDMLEGVIESAAIAAKRRALFSVAALSYRDVVDQISRECGKTAYEAASIGQTSMEMFFRTVTDRGFQIIEEGLPDGSVTYLYEGPDDAVTRPFCHRMLARTKHQGVSREWIDRQDNGQIPNVFVSCGGTRCRHQWLIGAIES